MNYVQLHFIPKNSLETIRDSRNCILDIHDSIPRNSFLYRAVCHQIHHILGFLHQPQYLYHPFLIHSQIYEILHTRFTSAKYHHYATKKNIRLTVFCWHVIVLITERFIYNKWDTRIESAPFHLIKCKYKPFSAQNCKMLAKNGLKRNRFQSEKHFQNRLLRFRNTFGCHVEHFPPKLFLVRSTFLKLKTILHDFGSGHVGLSLE